MEILHLKVLFHIVRKSFGSVFKIIVLTYLVMLTQFFHLILNPTIIQVLFGHSAQEIPLHMYLDEFIKMIIVSFSVVLLFRLQTKLTKIYHHKLVEKIGGNVSTKGPYYVFTHRTDKEKYVMFKTLSFLEARSRYECIHNLLKKRFSESIASKAHLTIFFDTVIDNLQSINTDLSAIKFSKVLTGSIIPKFNLDNVQKIFLTLFTKKSDFEILNQLYELINITAHQCRVLTRVLFEFKAIEFDGIVKNYDQLVRTYMDTIFAAVNNIETIQARNKNTYLGEFLVQIEPFTKDLRNSIKVINNYFAGEMRGFNPQLKVYRPTVLREVYAENRSRSGYF